MNLSKREKRIFALCLAMIGVYLAYRGAVIPLKAMTEDLERKTQVTEKQLAGALAVIQKSKATQQRYKTTLEQFKQKATDEEVMSSILSEIEAAANRITVRISHMKPRPGRAIDFYNYFSVSLALEGELPDILQFLHLLQNPPHMFHVEDLNLSRSSPRNSTLRCRLVLGRVLIP